MNTVAEVAAVVGLAAAAFGLYKGVVEYILQGKQKRAEIFFKKQAEFFGNQSFAQIRGLLEGDKSELLQIPFENKRAFLTFFEEVAVLKNSGLLHPDLVYYFFGYYAVVCDESKNFWHDVDDAEIFWNVFKGFAKEMTRRLRQQREVVAERLSV